jgi:hypothetical protein
MKKSKLFLTTGLCLTLCACTIACTNQKAPETTTTATTTTTTAPAPVDKGTLSIPQVYAWVDYPDSDFYPIFSIPESAEPLTYTYDTEGISIDAGKNTVKALKEGEYTVIAKSESFEAEFKVIAQKINRSEKGANGKVKFSASEYASQAANRKTQWESKGVDGQTTVFIGDSFFDTAFWSNFYNVSYPGKDALCLGISATTTYDWEEWITRGWLSQAKPKNIVMHMGTNNVYDDGEDVAGTVSSLQRMFTLMHEQFPDTPIYWFGISQRSYDLEKIAAVKKINKQMQAWCDARDYITYIDTPSQLKNDMLKDNVHPKVEHYSVFVNALAKTDIVIGDAAVVESAEIEDISLTSSQSINSGSSLNTITYKNTILSSNYVLEGKLDIIKRTSNAHIQFGILDNGNERILLWDNNSDGNVKLVIPYNTNVPAEDIYKHQNGSTLTLDWKIVATDDDVYFYLNGELKLVYAAQKGLSSHPLTLGSEGVECKFYDMKAITKDADPDAFNAALGEMADVIDQYGSKTAAEKIRT